MRLPHASAAAALVVAAAAAVPADAAVIPTRSAKSIARAMAVHSSQIAGAVWGKLPPRGRPAAVSTTKRVGFPRFHGRFAILSSGDARGIVRRDTSESTSHDNGGRLFRGTRDTVTLRVSVRVPKAANCLSVRYRFLSEEHPEFVGTQYNDGFLIELDRNDWRSPKGSSAIRAPHNFAFDWKKHLISVNGTGDFSVQDWRADGTTFDAATRVLRASTPVEPGLHRIYLTIFDQGDRQYDSAVVLDGLNATRRIPCTQGSGLYT